MCVFNVFLFVDDVSFKFPCFFSLSVSLFQFALFKHMAYFIRTFEYNKAAHKNNTIFFLFLYFAFDFYCFCFVAISSLYKPHKKCRQPHS